MRAIKFRGYAVPEMIGGQWLYGFGVDPIEYAEHYAKEIGRDKDWYLYTDSGTFHVHEKSIGQYTGLKDKNGTEIYEGDIVKGKRSSHWHGGYDLIEAPVLYDCRYAMFVAAGALRTIEDIEVIGNIYENPEVLKEVGANE